jgi:hypothetical protein
MHMRAHPRTCSKELGGRDWLHLTEPSDLTPRRLFSES